VAAESRGPEGGTPDDVVTTKGTDVVMDEVALLETTWIVVVEEEEVEVKEVGTVIGGAFGEMRMVSPVGTAAFESLA
jgi:hypothetical protein